FGRELEEATTSQSLLQSPQPRTFTILRRLLEKSKACIVHSRYAERELRLKGFRGPVAVINHGAEARTLDGEPYRRMLGLRQDTPLIGLFGYDRPDKRTLDALQVFAELRRAIPDAHMILVGRPHPELDLARARGDSELAGHVSALGHMPDLADFDGYL